MFAAIAFACVALKWAWLVWCVVLYCTMDGAVRLRLDQSAFGFLRCLDIDFGLRHCFVASVSRSVSEIPNLLRFERLDVAGMSVEGGRMDSAINPM